MSNKKLDEQIAKSLKDPKMQKEINEHITEYVTERLMKTGQFEASKEELMEAVGGQSALWCQYHPYATGCSGGHL